MGSCVWSVLAARLTLRSEGCPGWPGNPLGRGLYARRRRSSNSASPHSPRTNENQSEPLPTYDGERGK